MKNNSVEAVGVDGIERAEASVKRKSSKTVSVITASVVVAVVILNVVLSLLGDKFMWFADLSPIRYISGTTPMYTLSEQCKTLLESDAIPMIESVNKDRAAAGEDPVKLGIVFCADRDNVENDRLMKYVSYTARSLAKEYPDLVEVKYINMKKNPSAVQKYKTTSAATIHESDVIVEFGSESLVQGIRSFYQIDSTETEPWAYVGEKRLSAMIRAVTRAEAPICCITTNHGESLFDKNGNVKSEYTSFIKLVEGSGYEVRFLDLEKEEIPEKCRMMITFDPTVDFKAFGNLGENNVSEIEKLDKYIDGSNAFFYICDNDSPYLKNLEEYLEEWGVTVGRFEDKIGNLYNYSVKDNVNSTDSGSGSVVIGEYAIGGLGATLTADMQNSSYPPRVVFGNSACIEPSFSYRKSFAVADEESGDPAYVYYSYYKNGVARNLIDVFTTYSTASLHVGDEQIEIATSENKFKLMTVTQEMRSVQESDLSTVNIASYVIALSSTDCLKNEVLDSKAFGNTDVLMSTLKNTSREVVPTDIRLKGIYEYAVEDVTVYEQIDINKWVYSLMFVPLGLLLCAGVFVTVRRRYK